MDIKPEYIEFTIADEAKFNDMKYVYGLIADAKKSKQPRSEEYWLTVFPEYSLKHFYFLNGDVKPQFATASKSDNNWRFSAIISLLQVDLDVELLECKRVEDKGRMEFSANGYPYGGITGLTMFLNSFDCKATKIDEGGGIYFVQWLSEGNFILNEIITPANNAPPKAVRTFWQKLFGSE